VLIGDVDCTSEGGRPVCEANRVEGYPTMRYYTDQTGVDGKAYEGSRAFGDLDFFVEDVLDRECNARTGEACSDRERAYADKMTKVDRAKLLEEAERLQVLLGEASAIDGDATRGWVLRRLGLLEQLLGRRRRRRKTWDTPEIAIASACAGIAAAAVVLAGFCICEFYWPSIPPQPCGKAEKAE